MKQIVIDTNVVLRYLLGDIPYQFEEAKKVMLEIEEGKKSGVLSILVINELILILENYYKLKRSVYIPKLLSLLLIAQIKIVEIKKEQIINILEKMQKNKFDFTDMYIAESYPQEVIFSFDNDFEKIFKNKVRS